MFNYNILKINKNESLLVNKYKLNATLQILQNNTKKILIKREKLQISINKIDKYIKEHHDESLQRHLKVTKILQFLR